MSGRKISLKNKTSSEWCLNYYLNRRSTGQEGNSYVSIWGHSNLIEGDFTKMIPRTCWSPTRWMVGRSVFQYDWWVRRRLPPLLETRSYFSITTVLLRKKGVFILPITINKKSSFTKTEGGRSIFTITKILNVLLWPVLDSEENVSRPEYQK